MILSRAYHSGGHVPVEHRIVVAETLARDYLTSAAGHDRADFLACLFECLDDPSVTVRERIAELFADRADAPRPIVLRLLDDQPRVSAPLFERSPLLRTRHLLDGLQRQDLRLGRAIANRIDVPVEVQKAIIAGCEDEVCGYLIANPYVPLQVEQVDAILDRFAADAAVLDLLQTFRPLTTVQHCELVAKRANALRANPIVQAFVPQARLERLAGMASDRAVLSLLGSKSASDLWASMAELYKRGFMSSAFVLRAAFCGQVDVIEAVIGHLSEVSAPRVRSAIVHPRPAVAAALLKRTGLPPSVRDVIAMALVLARELATAQVDWDEAFFAEALSEIVDLRLDQAYDAADGSTKASGEAFDDGVAALCQDIAADILQARARTARERVAALKPAPPIDREASLEGSLEDALMERLVDAA